MPIGRGETIGTAVVRILAEGSGLDESIRKEMGKHEEVFAGEGRKHAKAYQHGWDDQIKKDHEISDSIVDDIREGFGRMAADKNAFENLQETIARNVRLGLTQKRGETEKNAQELGDVMARNIMVGFNKTGFLPDLSDSAQLRAEIDKATQDIQREARAFNELEDAAHAALDSHIAKEWAADTQRIRDGIREANREFAASEKHTEKLIREGEQWVKETNALEDAAHAALEVFKRNEWTENTKQFRADIRAANAEFARSERHTEALIRKGEQWVKEMEQEEKALKKRGTVLGRLGEDFDKAGNILGKAFGKGSRNDFLNLTGGIIGGLASIPGAVVKVADFLAQHAGDIGKFFKSGSDAAQQGASEIQNAVSETGKSLQGVGKSASAAGEELAATGPAGMIAGVVAIAAALLALPVIVGTVVSAFSVLAAAATALVASLAFAVVGAVAPLAGLLLPLLATFGVAFLAINKLTAVNKANNKAVSDAQKHVDTYRKALSNATPGTDAYARAQKNLKAAIETQAQAQAKAGDTLGAAVTRIKSAFDSLRTAAAQGLFGGPNGAAALQGISNILVGLEPVVRAVAGAMAQVGASFGNATNSPGFKAFITAMAKNLPGQVTALGTIIKNVLGGIGGLFTALQPSTNSFLSNIIKLTDQFSKWANSAKGQASLKKFFDDARESAGQAWDLIKALAIDLGKLLSGGKDTGDSILESMTNSLKTFGAYLDAHPESLQKWFDAGKQAADSIGHIITDVKNLVVALDTPENRKHAVAVFEAIGHAIVIFQGILKGLGVAWTVIWNTIKFGLGPLSLSVLLFLHTAGPAIHAVGAAFVFVGGLIKSWVVGFLRNLDGAMGGISTLLRAAGSVPGPFKSAFNTAATAVDQARVKIQGTIVAVNNLGATAAKGIKIPVFTPGVDQATKDLANLKWITQNIPKEVTIGVTAKLKAARGSGSAAGATAAGGLFNYAQTRLIGEAGPEAVVPLHRPLSMVDPAVRELSAFAQGKPMPMAAGGVAGTGKVVNVGGLTVITPTKDPIAVAQETINKLVGAAYI